MAIKISMSIEQARDLVAIYGAELGPLGVSHSRHADWVRRAVLECAWTLVKARADEALDQLVEEAKPQARNEAAFLVR